MADVNTSITISDCGLSLKILSQYIFLNVSTLEIGITKNEAKHEQNFTFKNHLWWIV